MNDIYDEYSNFVTNNKKYIKLSKTCTCVKCKKTFLSEQVISYVYSNSTGTCPYCTSDLIIPDCFRIKNNKIEKWNKYVKDIIEISYNTEDVSNCTDHPNKKRKI